MRSTASHFGLGLLAASYFLLRSLTLIGDVDASQDLDAETFGREVLSAAPQDAILFAEGDQAVFTLWYFHYALRQRPDLTIVAVDLLHFDWYQENLRDVYPALIVPGPFPWPESISIANHSRPVCYLDFTGASEMKCLASSDAP